MNLWTNNDQQYAVIVKLVHWCSALTIVGLFALGLWMTSLDYYHPWYQQGPNLHVGIGFVLVCVTGLRLIYRLKMPQPKSLPAPNWQKKLASGLHWAFYGLIFMMFVTGYCIVTLKGDDLVVFDLFSIPSVLQIKGNWEDLFEEVHEYLGFTVIILAVLHGIAALKHHFIDRDGTLKRMLTKL